MANRWETMEIDFIFLCSKISVDDDCSLEIKRHLLLGRKVMTNLDSILKSRSITLVTKVHLANAIVFPVIMYGCEIWTIKKVNTKQLMLLNCGVGEDPWESLGLQEIKPIHPKKSVLNIHWKDWCWSWNSNFGHLMWRSDSLEKILMLGKSEGSWKRGLQRMR